MSKTNLIKEINRAKSEVNYIKEVLKHKKIMKKEHVLLAQLDLAQYNLYLHKLETVLSSDE